MPARAATSWSHRALTTRGSQRLALVVLVVSLVFPVHGLGVDLCALHSTTGLPCPGCGMSRAIAAMSQGQLSAALGLHPFVVFVWPLLALISALALLPADTAATIQRQLDRVGGPLTALYRVVLFAFLGFGLLRFVVFLVIPERFP